jgi:hypothetical protein
MPINSYRCQECIDGLIEQNALVKHILAQIPKTGQGPPQPYHMQGAPNLCKRYTRPYLGLCGHTRAYSDPGESPPPPVAVQTFVAYEALFTRAGRHALGTHTAHTAQYRSFRCPCRFSCPALPICSSVVQHGVQHSAGCNCPC